MKRQVFKGNTAYQPASQWLEFLCIKVKLSGWGSISLCGSTTVWWWCCRWWREDTHSTRLVPSLQQVCIHTLSSSSTSLSHLPFIFHYLLSSEVTIHFQSVSFLKAAWFELSLPAQYLAGSLLIALIFTIISFIVMPGIIQCFTEPYTEPLSGSGAPRIHL